MSLETWMIEFYPVKAREAAISEIAALKHSIRKWTGLSPANLRKHGVKKWGDENITGDGDFTFQVSDRTCALCHRHIDCVGCSLRAELNERCYGDEEGPYGQFIYNNKIRPMLNALRRTLKGVKDGRELK